MLNYGVSLHQAGNLSSAISCYDRVILEETVSRSIVDQAKKYKELAKAGTILESPTNLYNKIKRSGYVSERWNLAQQFKDLYPSDSRVQEVIDFAATSMLNYGVSLHQAGKYDQAVNCYNIILSENSIASKTRVDVEKYKTFALNKRQIETSNEILNRVLNEARRWIGTNEKNMGHKYIIDTYNNQPNLPRGMRVSYSDHWCDVFVSFIAIRTNTTHILGSEAYVPFHMNFFMNKGQWIENGSITPKPGDIAFFNWAVTSQPNYAVPGHISIVESVHDGYFYSIDGNVFKDGVWGEGHVVRRKYITGAGAIRGFARPSYQ